MESRNIFTVFEKDALINLVDAKKNILECKNSNNYTNYDKSQCWREIEAEFNSMDGVCKRSRIQLKTCYHNMKRRSYKSMSLKKQTESEKIYPSNKMEENVAAVGALPKPIKEEIDTNESFEEDSSQVTCELSAAVPVPPVVAPAAVPKVSDWVPVIEAVYTPASARTSGLNFFKRRKPHKSIVGAAASAVQRRSDLQLDILKKQHDAHTKEHDAHMNEIDAVMKEHEAKMLLYKKQAELLDIMIENAKKGKIPPISML